MIEITINPEHIEKAIATYHGSPEPISVGCCCPMWQAVNDAGIIDEPFRVGGCFIELYRRKIRFYPELPVELYTSPGWGEALKNAPYTFQVDL